MNSRFGQNHGNGRGSGDADLMRIRGLDQNRQGGNQQRGPRPDFVRQHYDPRLPDFGDPRLNNQGQNERNGTDAPPPYDATQQNNQGRNGRSGFNWRQFGRAVVIAGMMSNVSATDAWLISRWARDKDGNISMGKAALLYSVAKADQQYNQQADADPENCPINLLLDAIRGKDKDQTKVKKVDADDPDSVAFESGFEAGKQEVNVDADASNLKSEAYEVSKVDPDASELSDDEWKVDPGKVSW